VTLDVELGHRKARQTKRVSQGRHELAFNDAVQKLLRSRGRHRATVTARDAGPRRARPRTVTIRR
jgi:hypothetical protein